MFKHWTIKLYTAMEHYGFKCFVHKMLLYVRTPSTPQNTDQFHPCEILCSTTFLTRLFAFAFNWELMFWYLNISVRPKFLTWFYIIVGFLGGAFYPCYFKICLSHCFIFKYWINIKHINKLKNKLELFKLKKIIIN